MGYETRVFFVRSSDSTMSYNFAKRSCDGEYNHLWDDNHIYKSDGNSPTTHIEGTEVSKSFGQIISMVDLCKCGTLTGGTETNVFFYDPVDGNKVVIEDKYGDMIQEVSQDDFRKWLNEFPDYSRAALALKTMENLNSLGFDFKILLYGY
jgi:hypothetical protein